jgi:hypothetical protein
MSVSAIYISFLRKSRVPRPSTEQREHKHKPPSTRPSHIAALPFLSEATIFFSGIASSDVLSLKGGRLLRPLSRIRDEHPTAEIFLLHHTPPLLLQATPDKGFTYNPSRQN